MKLPTITLCAALLGVGLAPSTARAQEAAPEALAPSHPLVTALVERLGVRWTRAERALLAGTDTSGLGDARAERMLRAALERLQPVAVLCLEAAEVSGPAVDALRARTPRDPGGLRGLAAALERASAEARAEAEADAGVEREGDHPAQLAAGIAHRLALLAENVAEGVDEEGGEETLVADAEELAAVLEDAGVLLGRRTAVRVGLGLLRAVVTAGRLGARASDTVPRSHPVSARVA